MKTQTHKKEKKKPKGFRPGSRKGRAQAHLSAAIKKSRDEGFAWLTYQGERLKIVPYFDFSEDPPENFPEEHLNTAMLEKKNKMFSDDGHPCLGIKGLDVRQVHYKYGIYGSAYALIRSKNGICLDYIWRHEGRIHSDKRHYMDDDEILAIAVEKHSRPRN